MNQQQFVKTTTILPVDNIEKCCKWYKQTLGLKTTYLHEGENENEATNYAILERDGVEIHLILDELPQYGEVWTKAGTGYLYLKVSNIEGMYQEVKFSGATVARELQKENWGAIGFNLIDPSGNAVHVEQG